MPKRKKNRELPIMINPYRPAIIKASPDFPDTKEGEPVQLWRSCLCGCSEDNCTALVCMRVRADEGRYNFYWFPTCAEWLSRSGYEQSKDFLIIPYAG